MKEQEQSYIEFFEKCAGTFSEAICLPFSANHKINNVFGREVERHTTGGLSHLLGKAVSGLRCSALLSSEFLLKELPVLSTFNRLHVPLSVVVFGNGDSYISQIRQTGAILFRVNNIQELSDGLLMAQVLSEKSLTPVVILSEFIPADNVYEIPSTNALKHWFGNPDDRVPEPIVSQEMVFGPERRRMPAWLHVDQAVLVGASKVQKLKGFEKAAHHQFEEKHYPLLLEETLHAYSELSSREQRSFRTIGHEKPKYILITTSAEDNIKKDDSLKKILKKSQAKLVILNQLSPIPNLQSIIGKYTQRIGVLEPVSDSMQQGQFFASFCAQEEYSSMYKENGWFAETPKVSSITACLNHLIETEPKSRQYWLNVPLIRVRSTFPKHEILLQQIQRNYPELERVTVQSGVSNPDITRAPSSTPGLIREYLNQGPPYAKISRFFDDTLCLHEYAKNEVIADPFQAYPVMPIATASFKDRNDERELIPIFKPKLCEEIDELILSCAYGALPSALITVQSLIESGIKHARSQGEIIAQLTPVLKKWIKASIEYLRENKKDIRKAKDFLVPSFKGVYESVTSDDEKRQLLQKECEYVLEAIGELTVVVDQKLFIEQERREAGTGELFSLAVDPLACTGCGHCALVGNEPCMSMEPQNSHKQVLETELKHFEILPATPDYSVQRLIESDDFDPFAALLINRRLYSTFSASSGADMSQEETVLKYYLALLEYVGRPKYKAEINTINSTIDKLSVGIKDLLSGSLPVTQLDSLMNVLDKHKETRVNMNQIFKEWGAENTFSTVEKNKLEGKLHILEELKVLRTLLEKGISGKGRPSCTIVLDKSLAKLVNYPFNPFTAPVLVSESADTAALALGVCEGQLRHGLDQVRLTRRANLMALDQYIPSKHDTELINLNWQDLSVNEQQSLPPVILFATNKWFSSCSPSKLTALVQCPYPLKIFIIDKGLAAGDLISEMHASSNSMWSVVAQKNIFITNATLDHRKNLYKKFIRSIVFKGNSVVNVFAPNVDLYDIHPANWMKLSALANSSRAFLQWTFEPEIPSESIASKISTEIKDVLQDFQLVQLDFTENGDAKRINYPMTFADWAYMVHDLKKHFTKTTNSNNIAFVGDYLALKQQERANRIPVIVRVDAEGEGVYYKVGTKIIEACELTLNKLKTLREWAGLYSEFPDKLKSQVNEALKKEYEQIRIEFEKKVDDDVKAWEANYLLEMKEKIKNKLLNMSGM